MGLASQKVQPETSLTFCDPSCVPGKQRPRGAVNPKCVVTRGNLATELPSLRRSCCYHSGGGGLFCFDLFKMLNQISFLKCCSRTQCYLETARRDRSRQSGCILADTLAAAQTPCLRPRCPVAICLLCLISNSCRGMKLKDRFVGFFLFLFLFFLPIM